MQFDENGTRVQNDVYIQQYRREKNTSNIISRVVFGIIHSHNNDSFDYVSNESNSSVWPGMHYAFNVCYLICTIIRWYTT